MALLNESQLKRLLFFFLTLVGVIIIMTSCTKTVIYPDKPLDVHFKLTVKNKEVKQTVTLGFDKEIKTIVLYGDLDYVIKKNEGFCGKVTFLVNSEVYTPITMSIVYGSELTSHICTEVDTTIHGFNNDIIYIPCN